MTPFLNTLLASPSLHQGGTEFGSSRDLRIMNCGLSQHFAEQQTRRPFEFPVHTLDSKGKPKVIGYRAGLFGHALNERIDNGLLSDAEIKSVKSADLAEIDPSLAAGVATFQRRNMYDRTSLGTFQSAETPVRGMIAGFPRTGLVDRVHAIETDAQLDWYANHGQVMLEPGLYLHDYKFLGAVTSDGATKYALQLQGAMYMELFAQMFPALPIRGMLIDLISRADKPTIDRLVVQVPFHREKNLRVLEHLVLAAEARRTEGSANPVGCAGGYQPCPYRNLGCLRHGTAADHTAAFEHVRSFNLIEEIDE